VSVDRRVASGRVVLILAWLAAAVSLAVILVSGGGTDRFGAVRAAIHAAYVAALLWYLARSGPSMAILPASPLGPAADGRAGRIAAAAAAVVLCLAGLIEPGLALLLFAASALIVLVAWRRQITGRAVLLGLAVSGLAFVTGGLAFWRHDFVAKPMLAFALVAIPFMFVAGALLVTRTGLGAVRVLDSRPAEAGRSFASGFLMFVPLALANAAGPARPGLTWVTAWWQPIALPVWSATVEETIFRLLLVCLLFALAQPVLRHAPAAAGLAVLFSAATFGLAHGQTVGNLLGAGLGYGLPMAIVFVRRDWEHAVGAHYATNFAPWVMALLAR
jgi:hypothetical protein